MVDLCNTHFFKIISLESQQNADISISLKEEGNDISLQISLEKQTHL